MKKTFKQWAKQDKDLDEFLSPGDYIDERLYNYIGEITLSCILLKRLYSRV
mgnify:CR=1 FL=1